MVDPLYSSSKFYMQAVAQLESVAPYVGVGPDIISLLSMPKRALIVTVPVKMDPKPGEKEGEIRTFLGIRVQHSLSSGPGKGGLRFNKSVDLGEVAALAMLMTWKCSLAGLPYGGAKGGVACDPYSLSIGEQERVTRRFTAEVLPFIGPHEDVMAPDMGTNEQNMAWIYDTYSMMKGTSCPQVVTGKSVAMHGTRGRREATGRGLVYTVERAASQIKMPLRGSTAIIQGFGNVGSVAAVEMAYLGVKITGVADVSGNYYRKEGFPVEELVEHTNVHRTLDGFPGIQADKVTKAELVGMPCDIFAPCAMEREITGELARTLKCKILAEGANGPCTEEADAFLREHSDQVFVIPDILCNSGGVIVSYFEWVQDLAMHFWGEEQVKKELRHRIEQAFYESLNVAKRHNIDMRTAALTKGVERVAMENKIRGLYP